MNPLLNQLVRDFGTPFYAYDLNAARGQAERLQSLFPASGKHSLFYSFKANPLPSLAGEFRASGCRADLTSEGELVAAAEAGFDLGQALYGGPGKSSAELAAALDAGVRNFSIESWTDLATLAERAEIAGIRVTGLLRVNPAEPPKARVAMSGVASQFGFEEETLHGEAARERIARYSGSVSLKGFHIYWGTQLGDVEALAASFESAIQTAERLAKELDLPLEILNLGGGFPWPYAHRGTGPDLAPLGAELQRLHDAAGAARDAEWWFESGRYLAASSGHLVTRVMDMKDSKDRRFVILDSGIHHLGGMAGLGRIPRFSVDLDADEVRDTEGPVDVVGQLCTPLDCLARNLETGRLEIGDVVSIPNVGAYGLTASVTGFLSRPVPLEIAYRKDQVESVHRLRSGHERTMTAAEQGDEVTSSPANSASVLASV